MKRSSPARRSTASRRATRVLSSRQRWTFRVLALLSPLLLLGVLEIFLRISGYGYPASFFVTQRLNGREVLTDNWQFGWRFFPKEIARTPQPMVLTRHKEPGTTRIFVFGESAAMGDPEPSFGLPRMLQAMLELKFPSNKFEVINVAMTAINSHVIREIARDCAPLEGDVWVIYMGNNEVVGPFGAGTVFGRQVPGLSFIRTTQWLKKFRVIQLLSSLGGRRGPVEWEGMEMFLKQQVRRDDPRMKKVYAHFGENLADIVRTGTDAGAKVIVSTVAVNTKDFPPFASQHHAALNETQRVDFERHMARGVALSQTGDLDGAFHALEQARQVVNAPAGDHFAELYFHLARCELALGSNASARTDFNLAKETDTLRFRADDQINATIKDVAARARPAIELVDTADILARQSVSGILGDQDFYEHVHLTWDGNYRLARALCDSVTRALPQLSNSVRADFPTIEECGRRLAWTDWDRLQVYPEVRKRLQQPPFAGQFGHAGRDTEWKKRIDELSTNLTPEKFRRMSDEYVEALRLAPEDWVLHENFAKLLEASGEIPRALEQWQDVMRLLPHDVQANYHLGNLLDSTGRSEEALPLFRRALLHNPALTEARNGLALALANLGRYSEAERELQTALRLKPKATEASVNLGHLFAEQGKTNEAIAQYELALQNDTNSAAAHVNLGKLLNQRGDRAGAVAHYEAALRINPKNAVAHYNLGNALLERNASAAAEHYAEAVRAKPDFAEARLALALELAHSGNAIESQTHFVEAIRLQPNSANAHFNYGVLLAKQGRFGEAAKEFSETLRLQPSHAQAREFLQRAEQMR